MNWTSVTQPQFALYKGYTDKKLVLIKPIKWQHKFVLEAQKKEKIKLRTV